MSKQKENAALPRLSYEEVARFNDKKNELKKKHEKYLSVHPEIKQLIGDFTSSLLLEKPDDIFEYASSHFRAQAPFGPGTTCRPLVIAGSTGAGKRSLGAELLKDLPFLLKKVVSHTTRAPRQGEVDGIHYNFVDADRFKWLSKNDSFLEEEENASTGVRFGVSIEAVQDAARESVDDESKSDSQSFRVPLLITSVAGVTKIKDNNTYAPYFVYIKAPSEVELKRRLVEKHTYDEYTVEQEILRAKNDDEIGSTAGNFHSVIVNEDFDSAYDELKNCVEKWYANEIAFLERKKSSKK